MHSISKKISIIFATISLQILALKCELSAYPSPPNCASLECLGYDVIHSEQDFEIRTYQPVNWISFAVNTSSFVFARANTFARLFAYINGSNKDKVRMNMTAPAIIEIGFATNSSLYKTYFYLPSKFQANPPAPISTKDEIVKLPATEFAAVRRFEGGLKQKTIEEEAKNLKDSLKGTKWESAASAIYNVAAYSAPFEIKRINEIMIWFD